MWFVYILKSKQHNKSYVGCTNDIIRRLHEHNAGQGAYTNRYKPWGLIKSETYSTYIEARRREAFLKTGAGRKELKSIFDSL
ncbi:hypothetical protein A3A79_00220 [Candidatus Gottesmanbacteria bacterium RIFCSPLOWO2_01_FULL_43_11b]|uniref:GIY-YIG domain-containing protein n=1 Tax=Candidatus Gottesmanbacteria bacterium RIFCSPLOWO2_01_FULL_43_11b TaxID=1798392 RepID=A0A1F6AFX6_9BACT|nr:MAG: hypothetical protein A3A79_00220 [Candidatus Gottesmanbacteria bacterium RIFCSPLOWO2_01_FULL_43_11b]